MRATKTLPDKRGSDFKPDRDWRLLFGAFLLGAIVVFASSIYLYRILNSLEKISQARITEAGVLRLDRAALDQVATTLKEKQVRFDALLVKGPAIVDPSR